MSNLLLKLLKDLRDLPPEKQEGVSDAALEVMAEAMERMIREQAQKEFLGALEKVLEEENA